MRIVLHREWMSALVIAVAAINVVVVVGVIHSVHGFARLGSTTFQVERGINMLYYSHPFLAQYTTNTFCYILILISHCLTGPDTPLYRLPLCWGTDGTWLCMPRITFRQTDNVAWSSPYVHMTLLNKTR